MRDSISNKFVACSVAVKLKDNVDASPLKRKRVSVIKNQSSPVADPFAFLSITDFGLRLKSATDPLVIPFPLKLPISLKPATECIEKHHIASLALLVELAVPTELTSAVGAVSLNLVLSSLVNVVGALSKLP